VHGDLRSLFGLHRFPSFFSSVTCAVSNSALFYASAAAFAPFVPRSFLRTIRRAVAFGHAASVRADARASALYTHAHIRTHSTPCAAASSLAHAHTLTHAPTSVRVHARGAGSRTLTHTRTHTCTCTCTCTRTHTRSRAGRPSARTCTLPKARASQGPSSLSSLSVSFILV